MTTHQNDKRVSVTQNGKTFSAGTEPPANTVADRVYEIIDDLSGKAGKPVWFAQKELAEFLGVTPQTLSLAISELKADGLIGVTRTGKKFSYTAVRTETQLPMIAAITAQRSRTESIAADMPPNAVPANDDNHEESTKTKPTASATTCEDDLKSTISTDEVPPKQPQSPPETQHDDGMRIQQGHRMKSRRNPQSSGKSTTLKPINSKNTEADEIWRKAMMEIRLSLPSDLYDSFMAPTAALSLTESEITIATQSNFAREWLMLPLHHTIAVESVRSVTNRTLGVRYEVEPDACSPIPAKVDDSAPLQHAELDLTPCPSCGAGTMQPTTWQSVIALPGDTYFCRNTGSCSRLWNSIVGEFWSTHQSELGPTEVRDRLKQQLTQVAGPTRARRPGSR